ncbi:E3 ubiquitin-protein ligase WAV3-like [Camellia sinensis]|uniref:E3 ubiquitin-protein ligase WAV3-like n=1 Tax=Camellia sinensis TaxID=4442 RepID=UPI00103655FE|nr:E3 ubiquitin-protein ligase WAV3-like [Camellia sinensis]
MSFNDDEPIVASQDVSAEKSAAILTGKTKVTIIKKTTAPLEESEFKVMLKLTAAGSGSDRSGVDLVTVLDVNGSMEGEKLEKMKIALLFMIKKLSPIDRLSVVTFSGVSHRLCPLRQITENSQGEIENLVNALVADGGTNISAGLQTGLKVLNDRRLTSWRAVGIMLMSDGKQNEDGDAAQVPVGNVPIYTFGFGADHDPRVLNAIANHSMGGTFSHVSNQNNLGIAFSQCLAGLLTVVVQDLKLTVTKVESTIVKVSAGNYPQSKDDAAGSVTVSFGDLYNKEVRKVIVDLLLPAASKPASSNILNITYTYSSGGKLFDASPIIVTVRRTGGGSEEGEPERKEVMMEENRLRTAQMIKESRIMADDKKLDGALEKLVEAQSLQENMVNDESNPLIGMLKSELQQMSRLMKPQEIYENQGRPFALSSETSHNRQRFAARGDDPKELSLFATPRMDAYLGQAKSFDEDPRKPLPSVDEDEKQERAAEPLPPMVRRLCYYIQKVIRSFFKGFLKCCRKICVSDSSPQDG